MNMRLYTVVLGVVSVASLGLAACSSDDTGGGGAGTGGSSTTTQSTGGTSTVSTGGSSSTGGTASTGGAGGGGACRTCAEYLTDASTQMSLEPTGDPLCAGSDEIWAALLTCACDQCLADCPAEACPGGTGTDPDVCGTCLGGQIGGTACGDETTACVNDA